MIKGYQTELMNLYDKIRQQELGELKKRTKEIETLYPEIITLDKEIGKLCVKLSLSTIRNNNSKEDLENLRDEIQDLRAKKYEMLVERGYTQDYLNLHYRCPKCQDTGYIKTEKCNCYNQKLVGLYYKTSQMEEILKYNNFKHFNLDYYSSHKVGTEKFSPRKNMEILLDKVLNEYIPNFNRHNDNILLYGNSGTGKTFLSSCIAKQLLDNGFLVVYKTSDELIRNLKQIRFENNYELENLLTNCDLLVIDDLGAEQVTDFSVTELFTLLNKKILNNKKMIISTNLSLSDLTKTYAERITSRLFGNFMLFKIYGEDIRVKKNLSKLQKQNSYL